MPNRSRSGPVSNPVRVVAPISVNLFSGSFSARTPAKQHVIERFLASGGRLDEYLQVLDQGALSDHFGKVARAQRQVEPRVVTGSGRCGRAVLERFLSHLQSRYHSRRLRFTLYMLREAF